jgi:SNF2 family DNA or RNA helicase
MQYNFKTKPFAHQLKWWEQTRDRNAFAILWEQGTGKSKLTVDTAGWLYLNKKIDALIVIAPNGVHRNWLLNEVPTHMSDDVAWQGVCWDTSKSTYARYMRSAVELRDTAGLFVLAMNYDAVMTLAGDRFLVETLKTKRCLLVLDESTRIKNPSAKRTLRLMARRTQAPYLRILTGTPVANSPFDVYTQFQWLDPTIWTSIGCRTYAAFKTNFGVWQQRMDPRSGRSFHVLLEYRNLDQLHRVASTISTRVTKAEVLDLPPKVFTKRYFELSPEQRRMYQDMADTYRMRLQASEVSVTLAVTQLLRFQQLISGFVQTDEGKIARLASNPRLKLLEEVLEDLPPDEKFIIWAKFTHEIDEILAALEANKIEAVRYDGHTSSDDRVTAIERFQKGTARAFVANPSAAGEGLTLHAATTVIYYSNSFKLTDRLQSEDRAHRIGQEHAVTYIDLVGVETVDEKIVGALRAKKDVASIITGDTLSAWI